MNSFSVANLRDMLENQTLPAIVLIKKQYRVFEESESANFFRLRLLKPQKCPDSNSSTPTPQPCLQLEKRRPREAQSSEI